MSRKYEKKKLTKNQLKLEQFLKTKQNGNNDAKSDNSKLK